MTKLLFGWMALILVAANLLAAPQSSPWTVTTNAETARIALKAAGYSTNNAFTGSNHFSGIVEATNVNNAIGGSFTGNGAGLTSLNPTNLSIGTANISITGSANDANTTTQLSGPNGKTLIEPTDNEGEDATLLFRSGNPGLAGMPVIGLIDYTNNNFFWSNSIVASAFHGTVGATNLSAALQLLNTNNAASLTNLNASNLASGSVANARLGNAALRTGDVFTGGVGLIGSTNTGPTFANNINSGSISNAGALTNAGYFNQVGLSWRLGTAINATGNSDLNCGGYVLLSGANSVRVDQTGSFYWNTTPQAYILSPSAGTIRIHSNVIVMHWLMATNGIGSLRSNLAAPASITVGASPVSWTNTLSPSCSLQVYVDSSLGATTIAKNGSTIFGSFAGTQTVGLQMGEYITLTFLATAPTVKFSPFP